MAVKNAVDLLKSRIAPEVAQIFSEKHADDPSLQRSIVFEDNWIIDAEHPDRKILFADAMPLMTLRQVSLSAAGFYKIPNIGWDKTKGWGRPFNYYAFGMCVSEVLIDILTGRHTLLRTDILHDVGDSLIRYRHWAN